MTHMESPKASLKFFYTNKCRNALHKQSFEHKRSQKRVDLSRANLSRNDTKGELTF